MKAKRKLAAAAGAGLAPFLLVMLPTGAAMAHGYVDSPASRQAQCANNVLPCGPIKWEPQSVEGPKGLMSCSGGNEQFAELDNDSKPWKVTPVGTSVNFHWTLTARHATMSWEYFVDGQKVKTIPGNGEQPGQTVTHNVDLSGFSGQHKILARWNIADTANAFYSCSDVNIGALQ